MLNVLITGSSGFIGSHLQNQFNGIYNLFLPSREELASDSLFENIDVVIHLAGRAHDIAENSDSEQYRIDNTELTNNLFNRFLLSNSSVFIFMSSILVLSSNSKLPLTEEISPNPLTNYAKSKYESELYITHSKLPQDKRYFILRTPLVFGKGSKGNLMLLYNYIKKISIWPLGKYDSKRSFCDIRNLSFIVENIISNKTIQSGVYHVADDFSYNLNDLYLALAKALDKKPRIFYFPKAIIHTIFWVGSFLNSSFNLSRLNKLTASLLVSNKKIKSAIGMDLPYGGLDDLLLSFRN